MQGGSSSMFTDMADWQSYDNVNHKGKSNNFENLYKVYTYPYQGT